MPDRQLLKQVLKGSGRLQPLLERAKFLEALTLRLREAIDPVMAGHICVGNLRDDTVIITADSPAWLSNIRYLAPTLLQILQQQPGLEKLRHIQFKVQPENPAAKAQVAPRRARLSTDTAHMLNEAASAIEDQDLSAALQRLSRHAPRGKH
jgi:hypothetical protein